MLQLLYDMGVGNELFPLLIFIGIGAMTDFGPLLENPKMVLLGAAGQFGIFLTLLLAGMVLSQLNSFPRIPVSTDELTTGGLIALVAVAASALVGAILGGLAGMRFHRNVDKAAFQPVG